MVNSKEILVKAGIRNIKTLTRWHQQGIIPPPEVRTHPNGKGKMGFWNDEVLERCIRIREMTDQDYSLSEAVAILDFEQTKQEVDNLKSQPMVSDLLKNKRVSLKDGKEANLLDIFVSVVIDELKPLIPDRSLRKLLAKKFAEQKSLDIALSHLDNGFNPVLTFDGTNLDVTPDFMLGHILSFQPARGKALLVVQLLKPLTKAFALLKWPWKVGELAYASPKIRIQQKKALVEYDLELSGINGFKLIRTSARDIGGEGIQIKVRRVTQD